MLLKDYHPNFLVNSKTFGALLDTMQTEHNTLESNLTDLVNQLYISTATWGLDAWEQFLGVETKNNSFEFRRSVLKGKLSETSTTTKQALKSAALAFDTGEIEVTESASTYSFKIKFIGRKGVLPNLEGFLGMVETLKPAHLAYTYEFTYNTHGELSFFTHAQLSQKTYDQLRNEAM